MVPKLSCWTLGWCLGRKRGSGVAGPCLEARVGIVGTWRLYCVENLRHCGPRGRSHPLESRATATLHAVTPRIACCPPCPIWRPSRESFTLPLFAPLPERRPLQAWEFITAQAGKRKTQLKKLFRLCNVGHFNSNERVSWDDA